MTRLGILLVVLVCLESGLARAAGPFDGQWKGTGFASKCRTPNAYAIDIVDNKVTGGSKVGIYQFPITGEVAKDGTFTSQAAPAGGSPLTGKFENDTFKGEQEGATCGHWDITLERVK